MPGSACRGENMHSRVESSSTSLGRLPCSKIMTSRFRSWFESFADHFVHGFVEASLVFPTTMMRHSWQRSRFALWLESTKTFKFSV